MCMCVKSLQSCLTLCDPLDCSLPGSSAHGDSPGKKTGVGCQALFQGDPPNPGIKPVSPVAPALQVNYLLLSHQGSPTYNLQQGKLYLSYCALYS